MFRSDRSYFQTLESEESRQRYVDLLSRLIVFVAFHLQRNWDVKLDSSQTAILKNIFFDDEVEVLETTPVQSLEIEDIAEILRILFCRTFDLRDGRWTDTVYIFWSYLGIEREGVFKEAKEMTSPIAALQYSMRLTVLYLVMTTTDRSK